MVLGYTPESEIEPLAWPMKLAAAFALPVASIFLIAFPLSLYYSYDYSKMNTETTGQVVAFTSKDGSCVAETRYMVNKMEYFNYGDCIGKEVGQTIAVHYKDSDPLISTTKGGGFAYWFLPLFGVFLSLFGFYILYSCFSLYKRFVWHKKTKKMVEEHYSNKDFLDHEYNEEEWYAEQDGQLQERGL